MLEAALFDYDGTLGDTKPRQFIWFHHWAAMNKKEIRDPTTGEFLDTPEKFFPVYNHLINTRGIQGTYEAFNLPCKINERNHPVWVAYEAFKFANPVPLFPGIKEALAEMHELGNLKRDTRLKHRVRLGINTTNSWPSIFNELTLGGAIGYIDAHVTSEDLDEFQGFGPQGALSKPSKVSCALALMKLDARGSTALHYGDTISDLKSSFDVRRPDNPYCGENLRTVGVCWGYEGREPLAKGFTTEAGSHHFDHLIDQPDQMPQVMAQYCIKE
jgi:phosphoglycolate phosphatase-like HAD superfamily hydrolase